MRPIRLDLSLKISVAAPKNYVQNSLDRKYSLSNGIYTKLFPNSNCSQSRTSLKLYSVCYLYLPRQCALKSNVWQPVFIMSAEFHPLFDWVSVRISRYVNFLDGTLAWFRIETDPHIEQDFTWQILPSSTIHHMLGECLNSTCGPLD